MNTLTQTERACLVTADLANIDADCARGFSAVLPAHRRALLAHLSSGSAPEEIAYARALLLKVDQLLTTSLVASAPEEPQFLDPTLVLEGFGPTVPLEQAA